MNPTTPAQHREMCRAIRAIFDANVDFEADAERVREFLATSGTTPERPLP